MKEITHEYNLTRDVFDLEIEVKIHGEVIFREKANSLTESLLGTLFNGMGMVRRDDIMDALWARMDPTTQTYPVNLWGSTVIGYSTTDPVTIELTNTVTTQVGGGVEISGIRTPAKINGFWRVAALSNGDKDIQLTGASLAIVGTSAYVSGDTPSHVSGFRKDPWTASSDGYFDVQSFDAPNIFIGSSTKAATALDWAMDNRIMPGAVTGQIVHEAMIVAVPAIAGQTSTITVTRDFTNNSGATVTVNEVGLAMGSYFSGAPISDLALQYMARDLSTFTIPNGSTVEVSYRFNTRATATGGFLRQFNELIYRQMATASREAKDIDNANITEGTSANQFKMCVGGASNHYGDNPNTTRRTMQFGGVQVGSNSTPVDFQNFAVNTKVVHGNNAGQLFHFGTVVDLWISNSTINQFDVIGMFENISGATVNVLETGLNTQDEVRNRNYCISRHALAAVVPVPNGQCLKVTYRFSV